MSELLRFGHRASAVAVSLIMGAMAFGCSTDDDASPESSPAPTPDSTTSAADVATSAAAQPSAETAETASDAAPVRRVPTQVSAETSHWLGAGEMTDRSVELVWSEVDGGDVVYRFFRFERADALDPEIVDLVDPIHEAIGELSWIDTSVATGQFYTYVMQIIADDEVLERRWSTTLAVTDITPPTPVTDVTATLQNGEVLLEWSPSDDDVEFGSYGVYRTDLEGEPYIGGPGDRQQTSFIDDDVPANGEVGYEIVAFDFHGNRSEPRAVTVDLG